MKRTRVIKEIGNNFRTTSTKRTLGDIKLERYFRIAWYVFLCSRRPNEIDLAQEREGERKSPSSNARFLEE